MQGGMLLKRTCVVVAGIAFAASACGKKEDSTPTVIPTKSAAVTPAGTATGKPVRAKSKIAIQKFDKNDRRPVDDYIAAKQGKDFSGGVTELKSEDLLPGTGESVEKGDVVAVYTTSTLFTTGRLLYRTPRGEPLTFTVGDGKTIVGLEEGVVGMKVGGKRKLTIPPDKAFGKRGQRVTVPGSATVVYDVELIGIEP